MSPAVSRSRPAGRCQQVAEWVLTSFGREVEQVGSQGRPGGFVGESGDEPVGLVELREYDARPVRVRMGLHTGEVRVA